MEEEEEAVWDVIIVGGGYCDVTAAVELERLYPGIRLLPAAGPARLFSGKK